MNDPKKIRVMSVFGTRPEAIKMAPLVKQLEGCEAIDSLVLVTAQHRQLLDQVLSIFSIVPDYDLNLMEQNQTLQGLTAKALCLLCPIFEQAKPDLVLVHGDTTTSFVAALAAFYCKIPVGHVEAGLRTYDKYQPFPEESNRVLTGCLADMHFAPTQLAKEHLLLENKPVERIFITGNTAIDAMHFTLNKNHQFHLPLLNNINFSNRVIFMTAHRRENWGEPLANICHAVKRLAEEFSDVEVVYSVHPNPVVQNTVFPILGNVKRVHLVEPLDVLDAHNLMNRSFFIMSDSGGLQEEAPSFHKPVLVLRNVTERPEGVVTGALKLAGTNLDTIYQMAKELLTNKATYEAMASAKNPFGDGLASKRIVEAICYYFGTTNLRPKDFV